MEKDTQISLADLRTVCDQAVREEMELLIAAGISVAIEGDGRVYTDPKLPVFHLSPLSAPAILFLSLAGALQGTIIGLLIVTVSSNKLEGMAVTKLSSLMMLGAVIPYFVPAPFSFGFSFLPSFWMGKAMMERSLLYLLPTIAVAGLWISALWMRSCRVCR